MDEIPPPDRPGPPPRSWSFPAAVTSVRDAREAVGTALAEMGCGELADDARLIVGELSANAVVHGHSPYTVRVERRGEVVRIEVEDRSNALPVMSSGGDLTRLGGRGMAIVAAMSERWSVEPSRSGKVVWAELLAGR